MTYRAKHKFASAKADGGDATLVRPQSNWNDTHDIGNELTNRTGGALAVGDIVALSTANDESAVLVDTLGSLRDFVVALTAPADTAVGTFGQMGAHTVKNQGAVTRGNYLQKSATSKAVEDMAVAITSKAPKNAIGFALTGNVGSGTVVAYLFGHTVQTDLDENQQTENLLHNGDFEVWNAGTSVAPDLWTVVGAGASVARDGTNFKTSLFSASLTRVTNDTQLEQDAIALAGGQGYIRSRTYIFGAWVRATVASRVRLRVNDGVGSAFSDYHTGGGAFEYLSVTRTLDSLATALKVGLQIDTGDTAGQIDSAMVVEGNRKVAFIPRLTDLDPTFLQDIAWKSGVNFKGTLRHTNTADRTYDFPDFNGGEVFLNDPRYLYVWMEDFTEPDLAVSPSVRLHFDQQWLIDAGDTPTYIGTPTGILQLLDESNAFTCNAASGFVAPFTPGAGMLLRMGIARKGAGASTKRVGWGGTSLHSGDPADGVFMRVTDGNWIAVCRASSVETTLDTGVASTQDVFFDIEFRFLTASSVEVFVDGVSKGTISSNVPTASLGISLGGQLLTTTEGMSADYFQVIQRR